MGKPTILIVDDDETIAGLLRTILELNGHAVFTGADGAEALSVIQKHDEIDILICDVFLKSDTGPALAARLRYFYPGIVTVFTSGLPFELLCERGLFRADVLQDPTTLYIQKPFFPNDLVQIVESALTRRNSLVPPAAFEREQHHASTTH
jgi:CheY-like chemotaxis protein